MQSAPSSGVFWHVHIIFLRACLYSDEMVLGALNSQNVLEVYHGGIYIYNKYFMKQHSQTEKNLCNHPITYCHTHTDSSLLRQSRAKQNSKYRKIASIVSYLSDIAIPIINTRRS